MQVSFLRLCRHLVKVGDLSNVYGWLFQVARYYMRDERMRALRVRTVELVETMAREGGPAGSTG